MGRASNKKTERRAAARDRPNLLAKLSQQRDLLGHLATGFDDGKSALSLPLAVVIRVLVHDAAQSASLLGQLQIKDNMKFEDTADPINPRNLLVTNFGLTATQMTPGLGASWIARLDHFLESPPQPFGAWWKTGVVQDAKGRTWSRWSIVDQVANKEGGAHLDPRVDLDLLDIEERNSMGLTFTDPTVGSGMPFLNGPLLPSVRQIAFEIERTLIRAEEAGLLN